MVAGVNCALSQVVGGMQLAGLKLGETVVIQGAGGLGVYATAVAKEMGAGQVIVIDSIRERLELARGFGADELIDIEELPDTEQRVKRVRELTDNWGADIVAELVGHPRVCNEGLAMVGRTGRYLEIGNINPGLTYPARPVDADLRQPLDPGDGLLRSRAPAAGARPDAAHARPLPVAEGGQPHVPARAHQRGVRRS